MGCTKKGEELRNWENLQDLTIFQSLTLPSHVHSTSLDYQLAPFKLLKLNLYRYPQNIFSGTSDSVAVLCGTSDSVAVLCVGGMAPELIRLFRIYVLAEMLLVSSSTQT